LPQPRFRDLRRFCELDGWEELAGALGGTGDHRRYRKVLPDGTILRTTVSHGSGRIEHPGLWQRIWRDQLGLESEDEFWAVLRTRKAAPRGAPAPAPPAGPTIPAWIVAGLLRAGLGEEEIRRLGPDEARRRLDSLGD
jgi:hypothetical protein